MFALNVQKVRATAWFKFISWLTESLLSGATCDGATFTPNTNLSIWRTESTAYGHTIRLFQCPSGYRMVRDDLYPEQDNCVPCGVNEYLLTPITISNMSITCSKCPVGAYCPGILLQINIASLISCWISAWCAVTQSWMLAWLQVGT